MWELSEAFNCVERIILNHCGQFNVQQRAADNGAVGRDTGSFKALPYLGHLSLNPRGLQGRHGLLGCSRTVKIHEAVTCRRGGEKTGISEERLKA